MRAPVIRISIGKNEANFSDVVELKLEESWAWLKGGIAAMKGNLDYYFGIDRAHYAMHNISFWEPLADANQMTSFAPLLTLGKEFVELGVRFERPIPNCDTLWQIRD